MEPLLSRCLRSRGAEDMPVWGMSLGCGRESIGVEAVCLVEYIQVFFSSFSKYLVPDFHRADARPWGVSDEGLALGKHVVW